MRLYHSSLPLIFVEICDCTDAMHPVSRLSINPEVLVGPLRSRLVRTFLSAFHPRTSNLYLDAYSRKLLPEAHRKVF